ncbi:hypothetical protein [Sphingomonas sp. Leaf4]|uniref:hypothetical protein n=1 Tax=Sphingomonas sp. Leaf4 TaxID=2876553 RepID=UPI001E3EBED3|nr:hypothetical protein [Sphingomonas sp. Leaf4]
MRHILAFYETDRAYGGSEEGGWYFDCGTFVRAITIHTSEDTALRVMARANRLLDRLQRYKLPVDSCIYRGGRHRVCVFDGIPPARFPVERPRYS